MIAAFFLCLSPVAIDGDTLICSSGDRVRIWGVNAPEKGESGSYAATISLKRLSAGGLRCWTKGRSYNRIVARCSGPQGDVGRDQLRRGHAVEWCRYSRGFYGTCR